MNSGCYDGFFSYVGSTTYSLIGKIGILILYPSLFGAENTP
jgi:hypothetical protein